MGRLYDTLEPKIREFIEAQKLFFVATAPSGADGHVNLSPKGYDSFRVLGERRVAYVDFTGSGVETIAHLRENGRITLMFCAFEGPPNIVRLHGRGRVVEPSDDEFESYAPLLPPEPPARSIVVVDVTRISDSCGFGVPLFDYRGERTQLTAWADRKGEAGRRAYQIENNRASLDGLPGLRWTEEADE